MGVTEYVIEACGEDSETSSSTAELGLHTSTFFLGVGLTPSRFQSLHIVSRETITMQLIRASHKPDAASRQPTETFTGTVHMVGIDRGSPSIH